MKTNPLKPITKPFGAIVYSVELDENPGVFQKVVRGLAVAYDMSARFKWTLIVSETMTVVALARVGGKGRDQYIEYVTEGKRHCCNKGDNPLEAKTCAAILERFAQ